MFPPSVPLEMYARSARSAQADACYIESYRQMNGLTERFREIAGRGVSVVSTIDHPFPSPTIHVFDGHVKLHRDYGPDVLVMNWDVSQPDDVRYRYDLATDTGLLSKNSLLYHYAPGIGYHEQTYDPAPLALLSACVSLAASEIHRRRPRIAAEGLISRSAAVINAARASAVESNVPFEVTRRLLIHYYSTFGQQELARFIETQSEPYSRSKLLFEWVPWCLRHIRGDLAFDALMRAGVFQRAPFRSRDSAGPAAVEAWSADAAAELVETGRVLPSLDVFLWSLAAARIRHFGNDRDLFARLADAVHDPAIAALQLTAKGQDCARFLNLAEDVGVLIDIDAGTARVATRKNHPTKQTRINTFGSLFVCCGETLTQHLTDYLHGVYTERIVAYEP